MQAKSIAAVEVLLLIAASVSVAACAINTQTPTSEMHDAFLEKYIAEYKNETYANTGDNIGVWDLVWKNSTIAHLEWTEGVLRHVNTFAVFPSTQAASNYLNSTNMTAYSLSSTQYPGGIYQTTRGHSPQTYKEYEWNEGNQSNIAEYRYHQITQLDNLLITRTEYIPAIEFEYRNALT